MSILKVYTDGACFPNPGKGGWAWIAEDGRKWQGSEDPSTNQRMELMAAINALESLGGPLEIVTDSMYLVNCAGAWLVNWKRNGWRNAQGKPVKNRELIEKIDALMQGREITFKWVRGHSGEAMNEAADKLASAATGLAPEEIQKYQKMFHGNRL